MPGVSRFAEPQHPVFRQLNASIGFDFRLGPYDVEQSRAHATMLAAAGIISDADRDALLGGLERVARGARRRHVPVPRRRRGHPHGDRAAADGDRRARSAASSTPRARATTRSRPTWRCSRARTRSATLERLQRLQSVLVQLAERHEDWAMPGYTHLQRAQPVYLAPPPARLLLDVPARRAALRVRARLDDASCRSARARWPA